MRINKYTKYKSGKILRAANQPTIKIIKNSMTKKVWDKKIKEARAKAVRVYMPLPEFEQSAIRGSIVEQR